MLESIFSQEYKSIALFCIHSQNDLYPALEFEIIHMETDGHEIKNLSNRLVINFTVNGSEIIPVSDHLYIFQIIVLAPQIITVLQYYDHQNNDKDLSVPSVM